MPKRTRSSSGIDLRRLARVGAEARLRDLEGERLALLRAFPDLSSGSRSGPAKKASPARRRRRMTGAQRKAASLRMKRYWAAKKKTAAK